MLMISPVKPLHIWTNTGGKIEKMLGSWSPDVQFCIFKLFLNVNAGAKIECLSSTFRSPKGESWLILLLSYLAPDVTGCTSKLSEICLRLLDMDLCFQRFNVKRERSEIGCVPLSCKWFIFQSALNKGKNSFSKIDTP